jgi:hypothetical protein
VDVVRLPAVLRDYESPLTRIGGVFTRFDPSAHLGRWLGGRDVANLSNYQISAAYPIFRLRARPELQGVGTLGQLDIGLRDGYPGGLDGHRAALRKATGRDIDLLIFWTAGRDVEAAARSNPAMAQFLSDLTTGFERVGRSSPEGYAELWKRR